MRVDEVPAEETWSRLKMDRTSLLIDVRTRAEWTFVGVPDLSAVGKQVITIEWQSYPEGQVDPAFISRLQDVVEKVGQGKDTDLFFICRSGSRSRSAAEAMAGVGYRHCHNVADGFEGPLDTNRHRGQVAGWKASGLPWQQN